jgi:hypothetical protein
MLVPIFLRYRRHLLLTWLVTLGTVAAAQLAPLAITTTTLPTTTTGSAVRIKIGATGGAEPLTWKVRGGTLPPGLKLNPSRGMIFGVATTPGTYRFSVSVTDSNSPAMQIQREFTLAITSALSIDWKQPPTVNGQRLEGSVVVANYTKQDFTLTVIVMAVNDIGRATALGYQEFTLGAGAEQVITFGSSPGPATYVVHADAVAEVASTNTIYRARKQTTDPMVIEEPE